MLVHSFIDFAEPVPPMGSLAAPGFLKLLGKPPFDRKTLLVRESVQNSWDARILPGEFVDYQINARTLSGRRLEYLREIFGASNYDENETLEALITKENVDCVEILDFSTLGLNGPTIASFPGEPRRFVNFVLNIGAEKPPDETFSGGTYGFGKGSYFLSSECSTILIHTRCINSVGNLESRLIGVSLGNPFTRGDQAFTGRHFFGDHSKVGVSPFLDHAADQIAQAVGFGVPKGETGTSVLIIGFASEGKDGATLNLEQATLSMANQIMWQCWPKLVDLGSGPELRAKVTYDGKVVEIPKLDSNRVIAALVDQFKKCASGGGESIDCGNPRMHLGSISTKSFIFPSADLDIDAVDPFSDFKLPTHHVALIRSPKLVVEYLSGKEAVTPNTAWLGTFVVANNALVDRAFALSEPPSHDSWDYKGLQGHQKTFVKVALQRIFEHVNRKYGQQIEIRSSQGSLASLSSMLGRILPLDGFDSSEVAPPKSISDRPKTQQKSRLRKFEPKEVRIIEEDANAYFLCTFLSLELPQEVGFIFEMKYLVDGGEEAQELPSGLEAPSAESWSAVMDGNEMEMRGGVIDAKFLTKRPFELTVKVPVREQYAVRCYLVENS